MYAGRACRADPTVMMEIKENRVLSPTELAQKKNGFKSGGLQFRGS